MYLIIKPVKMEDDFIDIHIYKIDVLEHIYHRVFETEQEIYLVSDDNSIIYWLTYEVNLCNKDKAEEIIGSLELDFEYICLEFWFSTKEIRIIK